MAKPRGKPIPKGTSLNPGGRPKSRLGKLLSEYLLSKDSKGYRRDENLVRKLYTLADMLDLDAIKYIFDRLEGKVKDQVEVSGKDGGTIHVTLKLPEKQKL